MQFSNEELDLMDDDLRARVEALDAESAQMNGVVSKIMSDPIAKDKFRDINQNLSLGLNLSDPSEDMARKLVKEQVTPLQEKLTAIEAEKNKGAVENKLAEHNLTRNDIKDIVAFKEANSIQNDLAAISLYAKTNKSVEDIDFSNSYANPISERGFKNINEAKQAALTDIRSTLR